uniref:Uncharacterized protein n=1 Tax=Propithecus coquereli TaxID=379532 RepID=A0A2K6ELC9_PROCO
MNRPAPVEVIYKNMRFLITHNPTNATLNKFIEELKKYGATTLVRVYEATYDATLVEKEGIHVLDWPFDNESYQYIRNLERLGAKILSTILVYF